VGNAAWKLGQAEDFRFMIISGVLA
jgi:hypothetical protein